MGKCITFVDKTLNTYARGNLASIKYDLPRHLITPGLRILTSSFITYNGAVCDFKKARRSELVMPAIRVGFLTSKYTAKCPSSERRASQEKRLSEPAPSHLRNRF